LPSGRKKIAFAAVVAALFFLGTALSEFADARGRRYYRHGRPSHPSYPKKHTGKSARQKKPKARPAKRNKENRIKRSPAARVAFMRSHPCPSTGKSYGACPGCVVDHVTPLKRGGADNPNNMQWQTISTAEAKDRWE